MTPRLFVICLGGLAGAGAVVCCNLDAGTEAEAAPDAQVAEEPTLETEAEAEAEEVVH